MSTDPSTTEIKLKFAREKKAIGDTAFKAGNITDGSCSVFDLPLGVPFTDCFAPSPQVIP
jgi:hypothetical protein